MTPAPEKQRPLALVTGASSGIGEAFSRALAARGYDLALVARRLDRLEALAEQLRTQHGCEAFAIQADLSIVEAHVPVMEAVEARGRTIDMLVNNAGYSIPKTFAATTWAEQRDFTMTLVVAVAGLTHAVLAGMIARRRGSIINVSSMAALSPGAAGHTLYPAAKSFVLKFSLSLDAEVRKKGVRVTCLVPGFVESEFAIANGTKELMDEAGRKYRMTAESVVEATLKANDKGRTVVIPGLINQFAAGLMKYLPDSLVAAIIRGAAEKYRVED
ncbi:MAG: SDR family NAD(P)-dependent oxidoreductase [Alphaproteobacteria bacterium]|nr:SDR family NAD(P)-dependent oxidoreductase [Alphaproteobacteria bacterium]